MLSKAKHLANERSRDSSATPQNGRIPRHSFAEFILERSEGLTDKLCEGFGR